MKNNLLKCFFGGMSLFMVYLVIKTSLESNLFEALPALNSQPWFVTTIVDFYFNTAVLSAWVIYRERSLFTALLWTIAFVFLGSIATCFYVLLQLSALRKNEPVEQAIIRKV